MAELTSQAYRVWIVEVFGNGHFSEFNWWAFNDVRNPETHVDGYGGVFGNFEAENQDVAHNPSRIQDGWKITRSKTPRDPHGPAQRRFASSVAFTAPEAARAYKERLESFGRWAHAWSSNQDFNLKRRDEPLQVRVVEEHYVLVRKVLS